jgi:DNA adenine methylase
VNETIEIAKPFLRWAGGKSWLLKHIDSILPENGYNTYHEPFLGGGSVFLALNPKAAFLSDLNGELIETYCTLKESPEEIINCLRHYKNTERFYYSIRSNSPENRIEKAARFIYLNQTSFNGIFRVNLRGEYNVPYGFRTKDFLEPEKLRQVSKRLQSSKLLTGDFTVVLNNIKEKDLVFLDPPYTVSHNHNGFIKYNQKLFSLDDQVRLSSLIDEIKGRGAYYILTNAAHPRIQEIFSKGDSILKKSRASLIGGISAQRGHTEEFVFTNVIKQ